MSVQREDEVSEATPLTLKDGVAIAPRRYMRSRGDQTFKERDVTRAIRAAVKAGVKDWRLEIYNGKSKMILTAAEASISLSDDLDRELADFEARHGQG